jgi:hypothetical protein
MFIGYLNQAQRQPVGITVIVEFQIQGQGRLPGQLVHSRFKGGIIGNIFYLVSI